MLPFLLQFFITILVSIIIVYSIHHIWEHLKSNYSTKKTKDLVNIQLNKYQKIIENIQEKPKNNVTPTTLAQTDIEKLNVDLEEFVNLQVQSSEKY